MVDEGEGDACASTDRAAGEDEGLVREAGVGGEEVNHVGEGTAVAGGEGGLEEEGFVWRDREAKLGANDVCELGDGVGKGGEVGVGCGWGRAGGGGGEEGAVGEGGVVVDEREEQRGASGREMDGEGEGKGDAEVVLRHGLALVDGVGLLKNLEGATDLDEGRAGKGVVGEGVLGGEVVEPVAGVSKKLEGVAKDGKSGDRGVGVDHVEGGVSKVRRAKIVVELVDAGRRLDAVGNEAVLIEGAVALAEVWRELAG